MASIIHKINCSVLRQVTLNLPKGAKPLCGGVQNNELMFWYERPAKAAQYADIEVRFLFTGEEFENAGTYLNTFFHNELVIHTYWKANG